MRPAACATKLLDEEEEAAAATAAAAPPCCLVTAAEAVANRRIPFLKTLMLFKLVLIRVRVRDRESGQQVELAGNKSWKGGYKSESPSSRRKAAPAKSDMRIRRELRQDRQEGHFFTCDLFDGFFHRRRRSKVPIL